MFSALSTYNMGLVVAVSSNHIVLTSFNHLGRNSFRSIAVHLYSKDGSNDTRSKSKGELPVNSDITVHRTTSFPGFEPKSNMW